MTDQEYQRILRILDRPLSEQLADIETLAIKNDVLAQIDSANPSFSALCDQYNNTFQSYYEETTLCVIQEICKCNAVWIWRDQYEPGPLGYFGQDISHLTHDTGPQIRTKLHQLFAEAPMERCELYAYGMLTLYAETMPPWSDNWEYALAIELDIVAFVLNHWSAQRENRFRLAYPCEDYLVATSSQYLN